MRWWAECSSSFAATSEDERTLAIFVSDNGFFWGEHSLTGKGFPYREAVEVPMYVRWPGRISAGTVDGRLVANIDIAPTIMDAAGVAPRYEPDGRSLLDGTWERRGMLLEGENLQWRSYLTAGKQYVRWSGGPREYYDLRRDPFQEHNALASNADVVGGRHARGTRRGQLTVSRPVARRAARRMHAALRRAAPVRGQGLPVAARHVATADGLDRGARVARVDRAYTANVPSLYRPVGASWLSTGTEPRLIGRPGPRPRHQGGPK